MTQIAIAEIQTEKAPREIEPEDSSVMLAQLIVSERGDIAVDETPLETKRLGFELVVAMIVAAILVVALSVLSLA